MTYRSSFRLVAAVSALALWPAASAFAQDPASGGGQSLDQAASDPTASVTSVMISDWWSYDYHGLDDGEDSERWPH